MKDQGPPLVIQATLYCPGRAPARLFFATAKEARLPVEGYLLEGGGTAQLHAVELGGSLTSPLEVLKSYARSEAGVPLVEANTVACGRCGACREAEDAPLLCTRPQAVVWRPGKPVASWVSHR